MRYYFAVALPNGNFKVVRPSTGTQFEMTRDGLDQVSEKLRHTGWENGGRYCLL